MHGSEQEYLLTPHIHILSKMVIGLARVEAPRSQFTTRKREDQSTNDWEQLKAPPEEEVKRGIPS